MGEREAPYLDTPVRSTYAQPAIRFVRASSTYCIRLGLDSEYVFLQLSPARLRSAETGQPELVLSSSSSQPPRSGVSPSAVWIELLQKDESIARDCNEKDDWCRFIVYRLSKEVWK